jgi:NADH:ubiquinone oxidoreductase subunit C
MEMAIEERLKSLLSEDIVEITIPKERRISIKIRPNALKKAISNLVNNLGLKHLSTITGVDLGADLEVIYHLVYEGAVVISLRLTVSKEGPSIESITELIPGSMLYEREVHDMFGIKFDGHPDLSPLILPEQWPTNIHPLRKEHDLEKIKNLIFKD